MDGKPDIFEAYRQICLNSGAVRIVSPDFYQQFADLSDADMEDLIADLAIANADSINRMVFVVPRTHSDQDVADLIRTNMFLVSRGYLSVNEDGGLGCHAPLGPDPTSDQEDALDRCIQSALPLVTGAIIRAVQRENSANTGPLQEGDSRRPRTRVVGPQGRTFGIIGGMSRVW